MIFTSSTLPPWAILLILVGIFGLIVLLVILIKKFVFKKLQIKKEDIDEKEAVQQELDRILVPIDEDELKEQNKNKKEDEVKKD